MLRKIVCVITAMRVSTRTTISSLLSAVWMICVKSLLKYAREN